MPSTSDIRVLSWSYFLCAVLGFTVDVWRLSWKPSSFRQAEEFPRGGRACSQYYSFTYSDQKAGAATSVKIVTGRARVRGASLLWRTRWW